MKKEPARNLKFKKVLQGYGRCIGCVGLLQVPSSLNRGEGDITYIW